MGAWSQQKKFTFTNLESRSNLFIPGFVMFID